MWVRQSHEPSIAGNGEHTTEKNGDDWGVVSGIVLSTLFQQSAGYTELYPVKLLRGWKIRHLVR